MIGYKTHNEYSVRDSALFFTAGLAPFQFWRPCRGSSVHPAREAAETSPGVGSPLQKWDLSGQIQLDAADVEDGMLLQVGETTVEKDIRWGHLLPSTLLYMQYVLIEEFHFLWMFTYQRLALQVLNTNSLYEGRISRKPFFALQKFPPL